MKNNIELRLIELGKDVDWLAKESEQGTKRLKNIISGMTRTYLWEAALIAAVLETDIWELWPELPKRKSHIEPRYADVDAEVDKRLGDETTPQYRELIDNDFLHGRLNGAVFKN